MRAPVPSRRRVLSFAVCVMPLAGCSLLFAQPAPQLYRLAPQTEDPPNQRLVHQQLVIVLPVSPQSLDTDRIALTRNRATLDYFSGASWTDRTPVLLQGLLVRAFEDSGRIIGVGRDSSGLTPDYLLETDLREFEARYGEAGSQLPTVAVSLVVQLVKMPDRHIIGSVRIAEQAPAARNDLASIVDAFDTAVGEVLTQVVVWTLQVMARGR
jgi:cholesterol transport system auxiliary component